MPIITACPAQKEAGAILAVQDSPDPVLADDGVLVGLVLWESETAFSASVHLARDAVDGDPFEEWEAAPVEGYRLTEV